MSSRRRAVRSRYVRICEKCHCTVTGRHSFANFCYNVLCRSCFWQIARGMNVEVQVSQVVIATTAGNVAVPGRESVKIGLNVYRPVGR